MPRATIRCARATSSSRFAISNGFLGIRGARATTRGARWIVPPRTYVAGLFDTSGTQEALSELVPAADWLQVRILLPGGPLVHHPGDVSSHRMTLDLRRGALLSASRLKTSELGMLRLRTLRLVSLSERAVGLQLIQMEIEKGEVEITFEASFEGVNLGLVSQRLEQDLGVWRTHSSGKGLAMATASSTADRRSGSSADRARPIEMVVELEISSRAGCVFQTLRRRGAERHPGSGPWKRRAGQARHCATPRLARRGRGARGGLGKPLAVQRRRG